MLVRMETFAEMQKRSSTGTDGTDNRIVGVDSAVNTYNNYRRACCSLGISCMVSVGTQTCHVPWWLTFPTTYKHHISSPNWTSRYIVCSRQQPNNRGVDNKWKQPNKKSPAEIRHRDSLAPCEYQLCLPSSSVGLPLISLLVLPSPSVPWLLLAIISSV